MAGGGIRSGGGETNFNSDLKNAYNGKARDVTFCRMTQDT